MKTLIERFLSWLFPFNGASVKSFPEWGDDADDCYLEETEITISLKRSDDEIIKQLNS